MSQIKEIQQQRCPNSPDGKNNTDKDKIVFKSSAPSKQQQQSSVWSEHMHKQTLESGHIFLYR